MPADRAGAQNNYVLAARGQTTNYKRVARRRALRKLHAEAKKRAPFCGARWVLRCIALNYRGVTLVAQGPFLPWPMVNSTF